jgi:hypothetical protein
MICRLLRSGTNTLTKVYYFFKLPYHAFQGTILKSASVAEHSKVCYVVIAGSLKLEVKFEVPSNAKG